MPFSIPREQIITYTPEKLFTFKVFMYEWIDNLNFAIDPEDCLQCPEPYVEIVNNLFLEAGWDGVGTIHLMWIPPFMLEGILIENLSNGITFWHVKQDEDGISWILAPEELASKFETRYH